MSLKAVFILIVGILGTIGGIVLFTGRVLDPYAWNNSEECHPILDIFASIFFIVAGIFFVIASFKI